MLPPVAPYERLAAWRLSYRLVLGVYDATDGFPKHELYGLTSQARRAAFSVVANIAEGSAKRGGPEFRRYLDVALGSITELEVALRLARDRRYLTVESWTALERLRNHAGAVLWRDRKSTRLNSSHGYISYAVFCLKKKQPVSGVQYTVSIIDT